MHESFRLSRIRAPRGSLAAAVLLTAVFIAFGLVLSGLAPAHTDATPRYLDSQVLTLANWMLGV